MQAGLLTETIELYRPEVTTNEFGEQVQKYVRLSDTKAQVIDDSGSRLIQNNEVFFSYSKTFKIRRYVDVCENFQIKYQNKKYRIISIEENRKYNDKTIVAELINE